VTKTELITHCVLGVAGQCLHKVKALFFLSRLGCAKKLVRDTARTDDQRDILYHTTLCSAIKARGMREITAFVFPSDPFMC